MDLQAFQGNHRCECVNHRRRGWHLSSYWSNDEAVCTWEPNTVSANGPQEGLDGRFIADLIARHGIGTAVAAARRAEGEKLSGEPPLQYATASLLMTYLRPALFSGPLTLRARITAFEPGRATLACSLFTAGEECVRAEIIAVRVGRPALRGEPRPVIRDR